MCSLWFHIVLKMCKNCGEKKTLSSPHLYSSMNWGYRKTLSRVHCKISTNLQIILGFIKLLDNSSLSTNFQSKCISIRFNFCTCCAANRLAFNACLCVCVCCLLQLLMCGLHLIERRVQSSDRPGDRHRDTQESLLLCPGVWDPVQPNSLSAWSERVRSESKATQTAWRPQAVNNYINVSEPSSAMRAADLKSREAGGGKATPLRDQIPITIKEAFQRLNRRYWRREMERLEDRGTEMEWECWCGRREEKEEGRGDNERWILVQRVAAGTHKHTEARIS